METGRHTGINTNWPLYPPVFRAAFAYWGQSDAIASDSAGHKIDPWRRYPNAALCVFPDRDFQGQFQTNRRIGLHQFRPHRRRAEHRYHRWRHRHTDLFSIFSVIERRKNRNPHLLQCRLQPRNRFRHPENAFLRIKQLVIDTGRQSLPESRRDTSRQIRQIQPLPGYTSTVTQTSSFRIRIKRERNAE